MKFIDEAKIFVKGGRGGDGCLSFRREKYVPFGGPDGGDGGHGGQVLLVGDQNINTLVEFRYKRKFEAGNGQQGMGQQRTGSAGNDIKIAVPLGTIVKDAETDELIGEVCTDGQLLLVAKAGIRGLGNLRFKSSINQAPRKITPGKPGDERFLNLELKILADVGLLGMPNAGKSTFLRSVSAAKPKVADYPFTTLCPNLGVVRISEQQHFVIADIPGLIEGSAEGVGLGHAFLRHLSRTKLLLHLVDISTNPIESINTINNEIKKYSTELASKNCWLVLNKIDLIAQAEQKKLFAKIRNELSWQKPIYLISALAKDGLEKLCQDACLSIWNCK